MGFCRECGSRLNEEDRFCSSCGVTKGAVAPRPSTPAKTNYRAASTTSVTGWIIDILVGWIGGSILGGLLFGVIGVGLGANLDFLGVLVGTIAGIVAMRKRRAASVNGSPPVGKVEQFSGQRR